MLFNRDSMDQSWWVEDQEETPILVTGCEEARLLPNGRLQFGSHRAHSIVRVWGKGTVSKEGQDTGIGPVDNALWHYEPALQCWKGTLCMQAELCPPTHLQWTGTVELDATADVNAGITKAVALSADPASFIDSKLGYGFLLYEANLKGNRAGYQDVYLSHLEDPLRVLVNGTPAGQIREVLATRQRFLYRKATIHCN